jgi:hypothetical protein
MSFIRENLQRHDTWGRIVPVAPRAWGRCIWPERRIIPRHSPSSIAQSAAAPPDCAGFVAKEVLISLSPLPWQDASQREFRGSRVPPPRLASGLPLCGLRIARRGADSVPVPRRSPPRLKRCENREPGTSALLGRSSTPSCRAPPDGLWIMIYRNSIAPLSGTLRKAYYFLSRHQDLKH